MTASTVTAPTPSAESVRTPRRATLVAGRKVTYMPALDGIRAFAVVGVLLYHAGVTWMSGGFLGVDAFFVLSGFLITALLVTEWSGTGGVALLSFWARRARRLLPALFLVLGAVALYAALYAQPAELHGIRIDALASLGYVANWRFVFSGQGYFDQFTAPSPLRHMWSLAIEEQFYLVWPLVLLGLLRFLRGRLRVVAVAVAALAGASAALMIVLYNPGHDPSRVYYGTDTRAQSLLIGAFVAVAAGGVPVLGRRLRYLSHSVAIGAVVLLGWMWSHAGENSTRLYQGALTVAAIAVAAVIVSVSQPNSGPLGAVLSLRPLVWIGTISYGLYLWHWPIYLAMTPSRTGLDGNRLTLARIGVSILFATVSYYLVERPIRSGALRRLKMRALAPALAVLVTIAIVVTTAGKPPVSALAAIAAMQKNSKTPPPTLTAEQTRPGAVPPTRVLMVGDSVGWSLANKLGQGDPSLLVWNRGVLGCGITHGGEELIGGVVGEVSENCNNIATEWAQELSEFNPDLVVVLAGAWEVPDHRINGKWLRPGMQEYHDYVLEAFRTAMSQLGARGAQVVLLTSPYFSGEVHDPTRNWTEFQPYRVDVLNGIFREVVADSGGAVKLVDLNAYVSPGGKYTSYLDGVKIRDDGVHFTFEGSAFISKWLAPQLRAIALQHPRSEIERRVRSDDRGYKR
jgi:peptidoglycan/LPS O-acetylase OafA/YrhL